MYVNPKYLLVFSIPILLLFISNNASAVNIDVSQLYLNDSGTFKPYKLTQDSNSATILTKDGSFIFNKNDCTISFYNKTDVTGQALIPSLSYSVLASQGNSGIWNPVSIINNAACNTSIVESNGKITIIGSKSVAGAGVFQVNYTKSPFTPMKISYSATNNNPAWTNYHIGLADTMFTSKILKLGNQTYDLSQFNNTVLNRNWIQNHKAQLVRLGTNAFYDMGIGWNYANDITIHWINNQASITIDYTNNTPILSPGQTITVDPSISKDASNAWASASAASTYTTSFAVSSNSSRLLIVSVGGFKTAGGTPPTIAGVQFNGVNLTKVSNTEQVTSIGGTNTRQALFILKNPASGTHNLVVQFSTTASLAVFGWLPLYNVDQINGVWNGNSTFSNTGTQISINIYPNRTNSWIFSSMVGLSQSGSISDTQDWNNIVTGPAIGQHRTSPTIGSKNYMYFGSGGGGANAWTTSGLEILSIGVPSSPTISKVNTINSTAINATWNKPTGTTWFWFNTTLSGGSTTHINTTKTTLTLNNYTAGSRYTFAISAGNSSGTSGSSVTKFNYTYNVAPTAPTISSILANQARLSWTNPGAGANLTGGFKVYQVQGNGVNYTLSSATTNSTNHFDFTGLNGNTKHTAKISTRYAVGTNYTGSSSNSTTITFFTIPGTPTGLTITQPSSLHVHLAWSQVADNGTVTGTKIERSTNGGGTWSTLIANTGNSSSTYNDVVSSAGTYSYRVSTIKYGGTSSPSTLATRTIWNDFVIRAYHHDNTTAVYGQAIQYNSSSSNNRFTLVSGLATITGLSGNNNFTAWNSLINFIVSKQYNYNVTTTHSLNMSTADFDVDCPSTGTGVDVEVWTNGTNGHRITTFTTPTCFANNTMKWSTKFTANGNDLNSYNTLVYVRAVNATFGTVAPLKYNQTKVTTAFTSPYIISDPITVGTGLQTKLFNWSMNLTVSPAFTPVNFTVGHISVSGVNPITTPIKFTTTAINSSATAVIVTFPSTYTMAYKLTYGNEGTSQTLTGLPVTSPSLGLGQTTLTFRNPGNDFVTIKAYDIPTNTTASTILSQPNTNVPFVTQFTNFKNGLFGTSAMIGGINIIDLIVLIVAMIGLNRANEIVGAFMMVIIVGVAGFFGIITWPTAMVSGIALATLVTVVTMKKYQNS